MIPGENEKSRSTDRFSSSDGIKISYFTTRNSGIPRISRIRRPHFPERYVLCAQYSEYISGVAR